MDSRRAKLLTGIAIAGALLLLALILWLPFGFNVGFQMDGWSFYDKLNTARLIGAAPPAPASRPALNLTWQLAYALEPDSYVSVNLMTVIGMAGKGILSAILLYHSTRRYALSFVFGSLVVLLPADSGLFYLGSFTLHYVVIYWLLATYCLLLFYETRRLSIALVMILMLLIGTLTYEIVFLFVPVGLLALLGKARRINRGVVIAAILYLVVPAIMAIRYALLWFGSGDGASYQNSLLDRSITVGDVLGSVLRAIGHHFVGAWFGEGIAVYAPYAIAAGLIVGVVVVWLMRNEKPHPVRPSVGTPSPIHWRGGVRQSAALIAVGLLIIVLGIAVYLPTTQRDLTMRTYYFSSLGAALVLAVVGWEIARRTRRNVVFAVLAGALALIGCWRLLEQHAVFRDRAASQQDVLRQIIDVVPQPQDHVALLVLDEGSTPTLLERFTSSLFLRGSLSLIYDTAYLSAGICDFTLPEDDPDACHFQPGQVEALLDGGVYVAATYDRLIVLRYSEDGIELVDSLADYVDAPVAYDPLPLIGAGDPPRVATMLGG